LKREESFRGCLVPSLGQPRVSDVATAAAVKMLATTRHALLANDKGLNMWQPQLTPEPNVSLAGVAALLSTWRVAAGTKQPLIVLKLFSSWSLDS
jgi:hypothetical protein